MALTNFDKQCPEMKLEITAVQSGDNYTAFTPKVGLF